MKLFRRLTLLVLVCLAAGAIAATLAQSAPEAAAAALRDRILAGSRASEWVREITDLAGPRLAGSAGDRVAVAVALRLMKEQGFANVRAEAVTVKVWQRGVRHREVVAPVSQKLALTALGGSAPTPEGGLEGEILRVASLEELDAMGEACRGKIVFIDRPTARTSDGSGYGDAGQVRSSGPSRAGKLGATGLLIRSIGTDTGRLPHTGGTHYDADAPKIPAAALSSNGRRRAPAQACGARNIVRVRFTLTCRTLPDAASANVIGEVRGREKPEEIVLLGAHLDSWDLGTGAHRRRRRGAASSSRRRAWSPRCRRGRGARSASFSLPTRRAAWREDGPTRRAMPPSSPSTSPRSRPTSAGGPDRLLAERGALHPRTDEGHRGAALAARSRHATAAEIGGADLAHLPPAGVPLFGLSWTPRLLRLPPHGGRHVRPHRPAHSRPIDGGYGRRRVHARRVPGDSRAHPAGEGQAAGLGALSPGAQRVFALTLSRTAWTSGCWNPSSSAMRRASWFSAAVSCPSAYTIPQIVSIRRSRCSRENFSARRRVNW